MRSKRSPAGNATGPSSNGGVAKGDKESCRRPERSQLSQPPSNPYSRALRGSEAHHGCVGPILDQSPNSRDTGHLDTGLVEGYAYLMEALGCGGVGPKGDSLPEMAEQKEGGDDKVLSRLVFPPFDDVAPVWTNHLAVQFLGAEYAITFYAAFPPIVTGETKEERLKKARAFQEAPARPVAKLIVPRERMADFVRAMSDTLSKTEGNDEKPSDGGEPNG